MIHVSYLLVGVLGLGATSQPTTAPELTYLGKPITGDRMAKLYAEFKDKLIVVDGKALDVGYAKALESLRPTRKDPLPEISTEVPPVGAARQPWGTVQKVIRDSLIVHQEGTPPSYGDRSGYLMSGGSSPVTFRLRGLDVTKYAEGSTVGNAIPRAIFVGTVKVSGHQIQDYVADPKPPSSAQFAKAIGEGLQLTRYIISPSKKTDPDALPVLRVRMEGRERVSEVSRYVLIKPVKVE